VCAEKFFLAKENLTSDNKKYLYSFDKQKAALT
jgi:hypothetical protein